MTVLGQPEPEGKSDADARAPGQPDAQKVVAPPVVAVRVGFYKFGAVAIAVRDGNDDSLASYIIFLELHCANVQII